MWKHNKEGDLWVIVDSIVYDLSKFGAMHPGGLGVLVDEEVAGKDATTVFYGLWVDFYDTALYTRTLDALEKDSSWRWRHRSEVLQRPQYQRLKIGQIEGQSPKIEVMRPGDISKVSCGKEIQL
jgi:cytochrome b involved in lipid metabolism